MFGLSDTFGRCSNHFRVNVSDVCTNEIGWINVAINVNHLFFSIALRKCMRVRCHTWHVERTSFGLGFPLISYSTQNHNSIRVEILSWYRIIMKHTRSHLMATASGVADTSCRIIFKINQKQIMAAQCSWCVCVCDCVQRERDKN